MSSCYFSFLDHSEVVLNFKFWSIGIYLTLGLLLKRLVNNLYCQDGELFILGIGFFHDENIIQNVRQTDLHLYSYKRVVSWVVYSDTSSIIFVKKRIVQNILNIYKFSTFMIINDSLLLYDIHVICIFYFMHVYVVNMKL